MKTRGFVSNAQAKAAPIEVTFEHQPYAENIALCLYPDVEGQKILGFGSALTEAAAHCYASLPREKQLELAHLLYAPEESGFNMARLHIGSCDFCLGEYDYASKGGAFSLDHDKAEILPLVKDALSCNKELMLLCSPWSPPAWMKDTAEKKFGGKLLPEYFAAWGEYVANYLLAWRREGVVIRYITVQNEPMATQTWESCRYEAEDESRVVLEALLPAFRKAGLDDMKIFVWDHNKEHVYERARDSFAVPGAREACAGVAFHWYSGDHFSGLEAVHDRFPEKELIETEFCQGIGTDPVHDFSSALRYAREIAGNLNHWTNGIIDWNLVLDMEGGPYHDRSGGCLAPVLTDGKDFYLTGAYWGLNHFSRVLRPGAVRIGTSSYDEKIALAAAKNPDGSIGCVLINPYEEEKTLTLRLEKSAADLTLPPQSLTSLLIEA